MCNPQKSYQGFSCCVDSPSSLLMVSHQYNVSVPSNMCGVEVLSNKVMEWVVGIKAPLTLPEIIILCVTVCLYHAWSSVYVPISS